jgi:hypothetical protein
LAQERLCERTVIGAAEASNTDQKRADSDACKMVAAYCGISIEQFFQREPLPKWQRLPD